MEAQVQDAKEHKVLFFDTRVNANSSSLSLVTQHGVKSVWPYGLRNKAFVWSHYNVTLSNALYKDPRRKKLA